MNLGKDTEVPGATEFIERTGLPIDGQITLVQDHDHFIHVELDTGDWIELDTASGAINVQALAWCGDPEDRLRFGDSGYERYLNAEDVPAYNRQVWETYAATSYLNTELAMPPNSGVGLRFVSPDRLLVYPTEEYPHSSRPPALHVLFDQDGTMTGGEVNIPGLFPDLQPLSEDQAHDALINTRLVIEEKGDLAEEIFEAASRAVQSAKLEGERITPGGVAVSTHEGV